LRVLPIRAAMTSRAPASAVAMKAVRWALAFHVHRWYRLMHPGEPPPEDLREDMRALAEEIWGACETCRTAAAPRSA
jgi:hypothetical protein